MEANLREKTLVNQSEVENNSMQRNDLDDREANLKENDVDDRPVYKRFHQFYFVKFYEDQELRARIEAAENLVKTFYANQNDQINRDIEGLKFDQCGLNNWKREESHLSYFIDRKKDDLKSLQQSQNKLFCAQNANRRRRNGLYSPTKDSIKEHNDIKLVKSHYRMLHESKNLAEEKKILKEIKQLEGTGEQQLQATTAQQLERTREKYDFDGVEWDHLGSRKAIREHIRIKEMELDGLRKKQCEARAKSIYFKRELEDKKKNIDSLEKEIVRLYQQKVEVRDYICELRKQNEAANACYYNYLSVLNHARELAEKKDLAALEDFSRKEAYIFMSQWSSNNAFKKDYEKRIVTSLDRRQLSRDGLSKTPKRSLRLQRLHQNML